MASLSNLSKFLGVYKEWKELVEDYGLKWSSCDTAELIISRIKNTEKNGNVITWIRMVKQRIPKLRVFMKFMIASGLRYREAISSFNLIIRLAEEGKLGNYYNAEGKVLEHFRFKQLFIRRSKKAFITFVDKELVEEVRRQRRLTEAQINNWIRRNGFKSRFGDIREYYATFMTKRLTRPEIDFLQGRVSSNVFMTNYFNPALITDLKDRVLEATANLKMLD